MAGAGPTDGRGGYGSVLRLPGAAAFSAAGGLARLPQAMVGLGTVLMLVGLGRTYAVAGLVAGTVALAQGVVSPFVSRLIDRRGQHRVLLPELLVHAMGLVLLVLAGVQQAQTWVLVSVAAVVGASLPQFGACARARWTTLLAGSPSIHVGLSIESLIDEAVFIVGPVLVAALCTTIAPAAGLLAALGLVLVGGLLFLAQRGTEPEPHPAVSGPAAGQVIRRPGLLVVIGVFAAVGALFGLIEVGVVAYTREAGQPAASGVILALWASGSLLCGTWYGSARWRSPATRRFQICAVAMALGCVLVALAASTSLVALTVALIVAGLANAPTLITGNTLVTSLVPAAAVTEAYTWLGVAVFAGIAVGTPIGGTLIDHAGSGAALWTSAVAGTLAALIAITGQRALTTRR